VDFWGCRFPAYVSSARQELANDPLGILRPPSKLQHALPLASAYGAAAERRAGGSVAPGLQNQRRRLDPKYNEPCFTNVTRVSVKRASGCATGWAPRRRSCAMGAPGMW
jgi:hypothetical protein